MNTKKLLLSTLVGVSAGAILGILYAPEKGSVTRKKISNGSDDYLNRLGDKFGNFVDNMTNQIENMKCEDSAIASNRKVQIVETEDEIYSAIK